jgi:hypothetical protein
MRHPDDMKEKRKLNRNVICHDNKAPDVLTFDVETRTSFQLITPCEFVQHCVIVFRVVTHYMTNL